MGGYWSSKKTGTGDKGEGSAVEAEHKKSKYSVVYTGREVTAQDLPKDLGTVFVLRRTGSMYMDEDGHYAHEFYREKQVRNKRGVVRWTMEKISNTFLIPQGEVKCSHPRLHVDFPLVLLDSNALLVPRSS